MMKKIRKAFERLSSRFDFQKYKEEERRANEPPKPKRPAKRQRRR